MLMIDFWGLIIGIRLFGFYVYKLYPVAFVMVIVGMQFTLPSNDRIDHLLRDSEKHRRRGN